MNRPTKDAYYLDIAKAVSARSTCIRKHYGAVIVKNDEIISTGYNGSPRGETNCCDIARCYRKEHNVPQGSQYELCRSIHAEMNAIISARRTDILGGTLYLYCYDLEAGHEIEAHPCLICERFIKTAELKVVSHV